MFSGSTVTSDSKETELGSSDQEASPSAGKNMGLVLVPCLHMEVHPTTNFDGVDISQVPGCHLLRQISSLGGSQFFFNDWCIMNLQTTFLFLPSF